MNTRPVYEHGMGLVFDYQSTDAPYLAPVPHRGKRNEPAFVAFTCAEIAKLRGESEEKLREATTNNACRVFGWPL